ncbi:subtilase family protein [Thiogranum longum]|uniref:Subtilase family protein n=2 Tax=Thiogranum longum TaxID=1537524 RepID=A0A4R1HE24_9GAMM|nr:subtilase family protein [Thiogranum longum]
MGILPKQLIYVTIFLALFTAGRTTAKAARPLVAAVLSADIQHLLTQIEQQPARKTVPTTIILKVPATRDISAILQLHGATSGHARDSLVQVSVQGDQLAGLLQSLPEDVIGRLAYPHHPSEVISQGTGISGAIDYHGMGTDGAGVKIGIIDTGFVGLTGSQANGELPAGQQFTDYTVFPPVLMSEDTGSDHGTNVAEIVHDIAPGAALYLARISTDLELAVAVDDMIAAGVNVVHHTLVWFGAAFYDGTGPICDITNSAEAAGILWTNPAGNQRLNHYLGTFSDADSDLRHEFAVSQNYNTVTLQVGNPVSLTLNWDAYQLPVPPDYDLFLYDGDPDNGGMLVASSENMQSGGFPLPYETLDYLPATSGTFYIVVSKQSGLTPDMPLSLFSFSHPFSVSVTASSIAQPADCTSVVTVGATALDDTPEPTSSEGPTTDGRNKPDIAAPTGVETSRTTVFTGTSASSSHVAGAAALLFAQKAFCSLSVSDMRNDLVGSAEDVSIPGFDFRTGNGRISLDADGDGFNHDTDNCVIIANLSQLDTDGDQLGDACDTDDDNDGLTDVAEAGIGTDPLAADTDIDGLIDGDEVNVHATDPLLPDTDADGLIDGDEVNIYTTAPLISDTDIDGLNDGDEINIHTTNPLLTDTEGDGAGDGTEVAAGTDPLDITSFPILMDGDLNDDGQVGVSDILIGLRVLMGDVTLSPFQNGRGDVAPLVSGVPAPDNQFNLGDILVIQRKALGLVTF